jgi:hypothetical protein
MFESEPVRRISGKRPDRTPALETPEQWRDYLKDRLPGFEEENAAQGYVLMFGKRGPRSGASPEPYRVAVRIMPSERGLRLSVSAFRGVAAYQTLNFTSDPANARKIIELATRGADAIKAGIEQSKALFGNEPYQSGGW